MGAPFGNKNAAGGGSHHKDASAAQHVQKSPAAQRRVSLMKEAIDHAQHQEMVKKMNSQMRRSQAEKAKNNRF